MHRFARPLSGDFGSLAADLFGLDSGAQIGLEYRFGIVPNGEIGIHRTSDRTIEFFTQYCYRPGVNTDDENSHVHFLIAYRIERRAARQLRSVSYAAGQPRVRGAANRPTDEPDATRGRHELVDAIPQPQESRPRRQVRAGGSDAEYGTASRDSEERCRARRPRQRQQSCTGNREYGGISLRVHRAGRHESVCDTESARNEPGGVEDHAQHRRLRDPLHRGEAQHHFWSACANPASSGSFRSDTAQNDMPSRVQCHT